MLADKQKVTFMKANDNRGNRHNTSVVLHKEDTVSQQSEAAEVPLYRLSCVTIFDSFENIFKTLCIIS